MKLIKNAVINTVTNGIIENGAILFDDKIRKIGSTEELSKEPAEEIIDLKGAYLYPGLIDAHCHVGMFGDSLGFEGDDGNEDSDPITPQMRAADGINPFDKCFEEARNAGVTTVVTGPGSANPIGGQFIAVKTYGNCIDNMVVKAPVAMKFALGENPKSVYHSKDRTPVTRMGTAALIRETLYKAKEYEADWDEYENYPESTDRPEFDIKSESLLPVIKKEIPVKIHAHRADDICTALRIAREFDLWVTIEHCTEGELIADVLEKYKTPVMLGPTLTDRSKPELKEKTFSIYKTLSDKDIPVAIITDHPEITIDNLVLCAIMAVKHGMNPKKALEGITITAAKNCGIDTRVGSIEVGKDADFAIFDGEILDFNSNNIMTFIDGKKV